MPGLDVDLNLEPPESGQMNPIDWDDIVEFEGPAHELEYDMVWNDGIEDQAGHEDVMQADAVQADAVEADGVHVSPDMVSLTFLQGASTFLERASTATVEGSSANKRRFYSDDLKISIYLELLAKTDPPILRRGVSKGVARKFDVPLRVVQSIWKNGQAGGINGVVNKWARNCGRKRIEIDMESIKKMCLLGSAPLLRILLMH